MLNSVIETIWVSEGRMLASPSVNDGVGIASAISASFTSTARWQRSHLG